MALSHLFYRLGVEYAGASLVCHIGAIQSRLQKLVRALCRVECYGLAIALQEELAGIRNSGSSSY